MKKLAMFMAIAGLILAVSGTAGATIIEGQGVWLFDEGSGLTTADSSGNGNTGTLTNGPTWSIDTPIAYSGNHALSFDGIDDYVKVANSTSLNISGAITVEAWLKPNTVLASDNWRAVVYKEQLSGIGKGGYGLITNETQTEVYFFTRGSGQAFAGYGLGIGNTLTPNTWNHVVGTLDATGYMALYVNGVLIDSGPVGTTYLYQTDKPLYIGGDPDNGYTAPYEFAGTIDEVRILDRALTPAEVLYDHQHSLVPEPATLVVLALGGVGMLLRRRRTAR